MNISMSRIQQWWRKHWPYIYAGWMIGCVAGIVLYGIHWGRVAEAQTFWALASEQRISNVAVTNGSATTFTNPLDEANFIQITLNPGDAQIFTYCPPEGGSCAVVPSGSGYEIGPLRRQLRYGHSLGTVQTATDGATLQIVAMRVQ